MRKVGVVIAVLFAVWTSASGQSSDPQLGTWKLNPSKSKFANPNAQPQKVPATLVISAVEGGHHFVSDYVDAQGRKVHTEYTAKYDGKDYPRVIITGGVPASSTVAIRPIDSHTSEYTFKTAANPKGGIQRTVISKDGKTRTNTQQITLQDGTKAMNTVVYDKQ